MADPPSTLLDTDSDEELPAGWEERSTNDGRVYYANHQDQTTTWVHPRTGKRKRITGELPFGWTKAVDDKGRQFFVDHLKKRTTYTDPRLAFAMEESADPSKLAQRFDAYSTALHVLQGRDLSGQYAIVTGANSGIGFEAARSLALHGVHVVLACRNLKSGNDAAGRIRKELDQAQVVVMHLDLASLRSIKQFAQNYILRDWPLHMLICNAAVFGLPWQQTEDGIEMTFQVNHVGHFYLVNLLTEVLKKSAPARIVIVSSESHRFIDFYSSKLDMNEVAVPKEKFWPILAYGRSKLANILHSNELNRRLSSHNVTCNALHPGNMIYTGLGKNWWFYRLLWHLVRPFTKSAQQGAATSIFCATARELEGVGGMYFNHCCACMPSDEAQSEELGAAMWELTEKILKEALNKNVL
ncbi:WW domain-containing oxidoreductase-like [Diadema antillarum]|uniref:WW domain-containing oxidoreductase-like n=1 Tax=Diadema antillarum TaxID=105358 RepID=UPI003A89DC1E